MIVTVVGLPRPAIASTSSFIVIDTAPRRTPAKAASTAMTASIARRSETGHDRTVIVAWRWRNREAPDESQPGARARIARWRCSSG